MKIKFKIINISGLTLIEVLISIVIVAFIAIALLSTITQSVFFADQADKIYTASIVANRRIEGIKKFDYNDLATIGPEDSIPVDDNEDGVTDYLRTTTVDEDYDGYAGLIRVIVSVQRLVDGEPLGSPVVQEILLSDLG